MTKKKSIKRYKWQPELSISVIYWSLTYGILFLSIITILEEMRITVLTVISFVLFIGLTVIGWRRHFIVGDKELHICPIMKSHEKNVAMDKIQKIAIGRFGLTLYITGEEEIKYLMTKKEKESFVLELTTSPYFQGEVVGIEKSVGN